MFLRMAQNVYAKTGEMLFSVDLYACDNGAVASEVQEKYAIPLTKAVKSELPEGIVDFTDKLCAMLKDVPLDELIEISHEDSEWVKKRTGYFKREQRMDSLMHAEECRVVQRCSSTDGADVRMKSDVKAGQVFTSTTTEPLHSRSIRIRWWI